MRAALLVLLLAGCSTVAPRPAPPVIDCRQPEPRALGPLPLADEWVEWSEPTPEYPAGIARLSSAAAEWVAGTLVAAARERGLWRVQERCLDGYEKAGTIRR